MPSSSAGAASYGFADRLIHRIAFSHAAFQRALSDVENDLFADELQKARLQSPVFVTALPRAGTTLLLEILYASGDFFTFTYRQMPFVLTPLLWDRLSARFQRSAFATERAHGDGMEVSFDSPEAFEEVIWLNYLRSVYVGATAIRPLDRDDVTGEFRDAFSRVLLKLERLDAAKRGGERPRRYLSKNNMNVARLDALRALFSDAYVLLCVREPLAHAASLLIQHKRFSVMHREDAFARRYMEWIGHYDFGANFRPILFSTRAAQDGPRDAEFWLRYWVDAYRHVLETLNDNCRIVVFEALVQPESGMLARLADAVRVQNRPALTEQAARLRAPHSQPLDEAALPAALVREARAIYAELREHAL